MSNAGHEEISPPSLLGERVVTLSGAWSGLRLDRGTLLGLSIVAIVVLVGFLAPYLTPYDPYDIDARARFVAPSQEHPWGTDTFGRDILTRSLYSVRVDLPAALAISLISFLVGSLTGAIAGYVGRWVDQIVMRGVDILMSFPSFILAMGITAMLGHSIPNLIAAVSIAYLPYFIRLTRGEMLRARDNIYADAARCTGNPGWRIMLVHLLPNCIMPSVVQAILCIGWAILDVGGLSFIGLGIQPPTAEWGVMVADGIKDIIAGQWWTSVFPGLMIAFTVLGFILLGERVKDILSPHLR